MRRRSYSSDRAGRAFPGRSRRRGVVFNVQCSGLVSDEGNGGEAVPPPLPSRAFLPEDLSVSASVRHTHTHTHTALVLSSPRDPEDRECRYKDRRSEGSEGGAEGAEYRMPPAPPRVPGARCQVPGTVYTGSRPGSRTAMRVSSDRAMCVRFLRWGATLACSPSRLVPPRQDAPPAFTPCTSVSARATKGRGAPLGSVQFCWCRHIFPVPTHRS